MVLDPSASTFDRMLAALSRSASYDGGDQGFLNVFFANWYGMSAEHRLPVGYNMPNFIYQFMHAHAGAWDTLEKEVKVLHYLVQKPWSARAVLTGASEVWWHAYLTLHPEKASSFRTRLHAIEDHSFDRLAHWFVG
jgi:glycogenin glucosyltransferase